MSPAVGRDGHRLSHAASAPAAAAAGGRDSFLNYFFGKENEPRSGALPGQSAAGPLQGLPGARHVSQNNEPSISGSFRRGDTRPTSQPEPVIEEGAVDDSTALVSASLEALRGATLTTVPQDDPTGPAFTERENLETELIRRLISSYFNIVRESIADQVPKAVMHLLVNHSKDVVQNRLVSSLYKEHLFEELLYEDDGVREEREKCEKLLATYKEASKIIGEVL